MGNYSKNQDLVIQNYESEHIFFNHRGGRKYGSSTAMSNFAKKTTMDASDLIPSQNAPLGPRVISTD